MAKTIYINARVHGCVAVRLPSGAYGTMLHVDDADEAVFAACKAAGLAAWTESEAVKDVPTDWCRTSKEGVKTPLHEFMGSQSFAAKAAEVDAREPVEEFVDPLKG